MLFKNHLMLDLKLSQFFLMQKKAFTIAVFH